MKNVYVVEHGTICEHSSIVGIFEREKDAIKAARAIPTCFPGGWTPDGENQWENGCDFVSVSCWGVK